MYSVSPFELGPDASAVGLDESLADGQAEAAGSSSSKNTAIIAKQSPTRADSSPTHWK